jgi:hypothetical protein
MKIVVIANGERTRLACCFRRPRRKQFRMSRHTEKVRDGEGAIAGTRGARVRQSEE